LWMGAAKLLIWWHQNVLLWLLQQPNGFLWFFFVRWVCLSKSSNFY
jgi:hypothetical protein